MSRDVILCTCSYSSVNRLDFSILPIHSSLKKMSLTVPELPSTTSKQASFSGSRWTWRKGRKSMIKIHQQLNIAVNNKKVESIYLSPNNYLAYKAW